jgi:hypothetical protein
VRVIPKYHWLPFLVHFRVALLLFVLGGGRRGNQGGVHQRAFPQQQTPRVRSALMAVKRLLQRSCVSSRCRKFNKVVASGTPSAARSILAKLWRVAVVERIFERLVSEAIPLLEKIDAQHPLQTHGRTAAFALGIEGFEDDQQLRLRDDFLHAGEELFATGDFLLAANLAGAKLGWCVMPQSLSQPLPSVASNSKRID